MKNNNAFAKGKSIHHRCSHKEVPGECGGNSQENTHVKVKPQQSCIATTLKSHLGMEATTQTHRILLEHSPLRKPTEDCFWKDNRIYEKNIVETWRTIVDPYTSIFCGSTGAFTFWKTFNIVFSKSICSIVSGILKISINSLLESCSFSQYFRSKFVTWLTNLLLTFLE